MKRITLVACLTIVGILAMAQPKPGVVPGGGAIPGGTAPGTGVPGIIPGGVPGGIPAVPAPVVPKELPAYRLEFKVADQVFFVNSMGGEFLMKFSHLTPKGDRALSITGEFIPGTGKMAGLLNFEATFSESDNDQGIEGEYTCKGSSRIKNGQAQQLATLGHHVLALTVKEAE